MYNNGWMVGWLEWMTIEKKQNLGFGEDQTKSEFLFIPHNHSLSIKEREKIINIKQGINRQ